MTSLAFLRERGQRLRAFVKAVEGQPANFDECSTWPARWVAEITGREFDWPCFPDEGAMREYLNAIGGLPNLWSGVASRLGIPEIGIDEPLIGDVGIIETQRSGLVGGIFGAGGAIFVRSSCGAAALGVVGRRVPFRVDGGFEMRPVVVRAWRITA